MGFDFKPTKENISLHGLGFLQIKLEGNRRLHVWHPDLPRRKCYMQSAIHDHRFGFDSLVLKGRLVNYTWGAYETLDEKGNSIKGHRSALPSATHQGYVHEGERSKFGNRPWLPAGQFSLWILDKQLVNPGDTYHMRPYVPHSTATVGSGEAGKVATLMHKVVEGSSGAKSFCEIGVAPDVHFDRQQMSQKDMWAIVNDVLGA